jgi:hypothetical protein
MFIPFVARILRAGTSLKKDPFFKLVPAFYPSISHLREKVKKKEASFSKRSFQNA